jgi:Lipocalin-like domain
VRDGNIIRVRNYTTCPDQTDIDNHSIPVRTSGTGGNMQRRSHITGPTIGRATAVPLVALLLASGLAVIASAGAASATSAERPGAATRADVTEALIGTWRLKSAVARDQSGHLTPLYSDPVGKLTYTPRGDMWALVGTRGEPGFWYTGVFEVFPKTRTVVHHVEYSSNLSYDGTDQVRQYKFLSRNRLRLRAGGPTSYLELVWRRA